MSNTPSNAEAWDLWLESITGGHHPASLAKFARAVLAKWGTPQPAPECHHRPPCAECAAIAAQGEKDAG